MLPRFLDGEEDLRERWSQPHTRQQLLEVLERSGFAEDKLELMRRFLQLEKCDMLDVLAYLAYETTPMERQRRADILREDMLKRLSRQQQDFVDFILQIYVRNGFKELGLVKLGTLIDMKYHSIADAKRQLQKDPVAMKYFFIGMQRELYNGHAVLNVNIAPQFNAPVGQVIMHADNINNKTE
jgi:type I restriction enzyme R subunit